MAFLWFQIIRRLAISRYLDNMYLSHKWSHPLVQDYDSFLVGKHLLLSISQLGPPNPGQKASL